MAERVQVLEPVADELAAARQHLTRHDYVEAEERARRALLAVVADPERRPRQDDFDAAFATWREAQHENAALQARLLAREPFFGVLLEGRLGRIQAFAPQHTLLDVANSRSAGFAAGIRLGSPFESTPILDDLSLLVQYAQARNTWRGPNRASDQTEVDILSTVLHEVNFELMYRPRVASRLKPYLRTGVGVHTVDAEIYRIDAAFRRDGTRVPAFERTAPAFLLGLGIDVWRWSAAHARLSLGGAYRLVSFEFLQLLAPDIEDNRNTLLDLPLNVRGRDDLYRFDLSGWYFGITLAFEP
jgi:hypothetical protein